MVLRYRASVGAVRLLLYGPACIPPPQHRCLATSIQPLERRSLPLNILCRSLNAGHAVFSLDANIAIIELCSLSVRFASIAEGPLRGF